jgi:hypothetical protein
MIRKAIYHYMKENRMKVDGIYTKLTQLWDTYLCKSSRNDRSSTGFISIYSYYWRFLIDSGFVIDDITNMIFLANILDLKDLEKNLWILDNKLYLWQ